MKPASLPHQKAEKDPEVAYLVAVCHSEEPEGEVALLSARHRYQFMSATYIRDQSFDSLLFGSIREHWTKVGHIGRADNFWDGFARIDTWPCRVHGQPVIGALSHDQRQWVEVNPIWEVVLQIFLQGGEARGPIS